VLHLPKLGVLQLRLLFQQELRPKLPLESLQQQPQLPREQLKKLLQLQQQQPQQLRQMVLQLKM
jgi:hypothetical protein